MRRAFSKRPPGRHARISEIHRDTVEKILNLLRCLERAEEAQFFCVEVEHGEEYRNRGCAAFVKLIGSNALLKENAVRPEAKRGWRIIANRARFPDWWPGQSRTGYACLFRAALYR